MENNASYLFVGDPLEMARRLEAVVTRTGSEAETRDLFTECHRARVTCQRGGPAASTG